MKIAPSTPTLSIAATISSPVTCGGPVRHIVPGPLRRVRLIGVDLGIDDRHRRSSSIADRVAASQQTPAPRRGPFSETHKIAVQVTAQEE